MIRHFSSTNRPSLLPIVFWLGLLLFGLPIQAWGQTPPAAASPSEQTPANPGQTPPAVAPTDGAPQPTPTTDDNAAEPQAAAATPQTATPQPATPQAATSETQATPGSTQTPEVPLPVIDWVVTTRRSALYDTPSAGSAKIPLDADTPLILHEKDRYGWYRVETADKRVGWLPGFHTKAGEGPPPAELLPPPPPKPEPVKPAEPPQPPPEITALTPEQIAARLKIVQAETAALRDFVRLQPSTAFKVSALFSFDLTDSNAISGHVVDLSTRIAQKKRVVEFLSEQPDTPPMPPAEPEAPKAEPQGEDDTAPQHEPPEAAPVETPKGPTRLELEKAELALLNLRQAFLSHKPEEIQTLLAAEAEADRLARLKAKEEADRKRAEEEARAAEEARRQALERAQAANNAAERALALERAKLEGAKGELAEYRKQLAIARQDMISLGEKRAQSLTETTALVGATRLHSIEADELYDSIVSQLTLTRTRIADELSAPGRFTKAPRYSGNPADLQALTPEQVQEKADLIASVLRLGMEADEAEKEMREIAWERTRSTVEYEIALNQQRLILLERISPFKHDQLLGFGPDGIAQFGRELVHFSLMLRWMEYAGERLAYEKLQQLKDPYQFISIAMPFFGLLLFLIVYFGLRRTLTKLFKAPRRLSVSMRRLTLSERIRKTSSDIIRALYREILFLAFVLSIPLFANVSAEQSGIALIYRLLLIYGFYRLIQAAAFRLLLDLIRSNLGPLDDPRRQKLLRSVIIATRFVFWMLAMLMLAAYVLGKGYLYYLAIRVMVIGGIAITTGMIFWWRKKITSDLIALRPNSVIARELNRASGRWYALLFVYVGFIYLIGVGIVGSLRRLMQGFDLSQKLLAYLFRKKLEQRKEKIRDAAGTQLPPEFEEYFGDFNTIDDSLLLDHFPKMEAFLNQFESWKANDHTGSFLVLGKTGHGKTTWLREAMRRTDGFPATFIPLQKRLVKPETVLAAFSMALLPGEPQAEGIEQLAERVRAGTRRLVVLDNMQYLFMRGVDTIRGWWAFNRLMEATAGHVFWLGAFAQNAYQFLSWVRNDSDAFRDSVTLRGWDETQISDLLAKRMEATGYSARYANLFAGQQSTFTNSQMAEIAADFNRLIWDFTLGAPHAAIHYWKKSLVPAEGKTMDIRLFPQPEMSVLEERDETDKFVLAGVFWHQRIGADEAAESLRYPPYACRDSLEKLRELGVLEFRGHDYGVTVEWWPLVNRYLRRKNLIRS